MRLELTYVDDKFRRSVLCKDADLKAGEIAMVKGLADPKYETGDFAVVLDGETYKTIGYGEGGAKTYFDGFDVDYGLAKDSETELSEAAKVTMNKFIEAYNFVYTHTINL